MFAIFGFSNSFLFLLFTNDEDFDVELFKKARMLGTDTKNNEYLHNTIKKMHVFAVEIKKNKGFTKIKEKNLGVVICRLLSANISK